MYCSYLTEVTGPSEGEPNAHGIITDAETSYDWLIAHGVDAKLILVVGESMGTGVATILAAHRPVPGYRWKPLIAPLLT